MKSITVLALPAVAILALAGCTGSTEPSDDGPTSPDTSESVPFLSYVLPEFPADHPDYTAIFLHPHELEPWAVSTKLAMEEFGAANGVAVTTYQAGGYAGANVATQIQQIENAISQEPDVLIVQATDPDAISASLQEAVDAGIVVIGFSHLGFDGSATEVVGDYTEDAYEMANVLFDAMGGEGQVMSVMGGQGGQYEREMTAGFKRALAGASGIEAVADPTTPGFDPATVQELVNNQLTRNPDLGGVVTSTMGMAAGAVSAIAGGETKVIAQVMTDCSQVGMIESGELTFGQGTPSVYYSQLVIAMMIRYMAGDEVPDSVRVPGNIYTSANIGDAPLWIEASPEFLEGCSSGTGEFEVVSYADFTAAADSGFQP